MILSLYKFSHIYNDSVIGSEVKAHTKLVAMLVRRKA